jgi:hypothetical protein
MSEFERVPFLMPPTPADFLVSGQGEAVQLAPALNAGTQDPLIEPLPWLDGMIAHFSASSLRMLKMCPEQYRQRYILGRKERPSGHLTLGTAVHAAVAYSHEQKIVTHEDLPVSEVVEKFHDETWPLAVEKDGGVDEISWMTGKEELKPDDYRRDGERMTQAYHYTVSPRVQPIAVEQKMTLHVEGVPVPFIGYIDWEEETHLDDLKTGNKVKKKPDGHWRFQGAIYSLAKRKPTHFHSVSRAKTPSIATPLEHPEMVIPYREDIAANTVRVLQHYAADVETYFNRYGPDNPWPMTGVVMDLQGGAACNYCGFRKFCPAWEWERNPILEVHP